MKIVKIIGGIILLAVTVLSCEKCELPSSCNLEPDPGLCQAAFIRYYFDKEEDKCKSFTWGGCAGVVPFETLEECKTCKCD